ncbi:hypothetical protein [Streptomyces sp. NPDC101455]|uniref:hypothetical protein n=1 Tax=Streptomyces sp. NPDC101455 TaxID=3366142 RepID=UPI003807A8B9
MTRLPEQPAAEPRRTRGGAGSAGQDTPPWHGQHVIVPKRLWGGGYSHGAVRYGAQVTALDTRAERCRAGVGTLARYLGDSKRTAERHLAELAAPAPAPGPPAMEVVRHTAPGGRGITAERRMRPLTRGEHFATVAVCAIKALRPAAFVAYCALAYAQALHMPVTALELAVLLGLVERSARRLVDELEDLGWVDIDRRAGYQARHLVTVLDCPGHAPTAPSPSPDTDGGSGPDTDGGSLASKEDPVLTDVDKEAQAGGSFRRRRDDRKWVGPPVDNSPRTPASSAAATFRPAPVRPAERPAYAGPELTLSRDAWAIVGPVLAPVADLLPRCSPFMTRRIVREILRQIREDGIWPDEIRDQAARLRHWTPPETIRDPGRWLLGAVLPIRSRCGMTGCHWGFVTHTGMPCKACAEIDGHPPHTPPHQRPTPAPTGT